MTEKILYNRTAKYLIDQLDALETEVRNSRSAVLPSGFLDFDGDRFATICSVIIAITSERPVDFRDLNPIDGNGNGGE